MSDLSTKTVRNDSPDAIAVEYAGHVHHFRQGEELDVPEELAQHAQYHHGHVGLHIVDHKAEAAVKEGASAKAKQDVVATIEAAAARVAKEEPKSYTCEHADYAGNDKDDYIVHLRSAHGETDASLTAKGLLARSPADEAAFKEKQRVEAAAKKTGRTVAEQQAHEAKGKSEAKATKKRGKKA